MVGGRLLCCVALCLVLLAPAVLGQTVTGVSLERNGLAVSTVAAARPIPADVSVVVSVSETAFEALEVDLSAMHEGPLGSTYRRIGWFRVIVLRGVA
ncbi:MAG: hypothetical protein HC945_02185 [Nitrosarchaeum sp.]|nr:hypothetical protein [Nitrosarchaeum sp.]